MHPPADMAEGATSRPTIELMVVDFPEPSKPHTMMVLYDGHIPLLSSFLTELFGKIPAAPAAFIWDDLRFKGK